MAFYTCYRHFKYLIMPFGLANALATFQAYINTSIAGLLNHFVVMYLDNILIYFKNPEEYKEHMRQVLLRLRKYKLYAKLSKCEFSVLKLEFLSFYVKVDGIKPDLKRIYNIIKQLKLKSFYDMQVFFGFANFYCYFVYKYLHIAYSLINLLVSMENSRKTTPFKQTLDVEQSF